MAGTFSALQIHVVFSTKNRLPIVRRDFRRDLYKYIGGIVRSEGGRLIAIGGTTDHLHALVRVPPKTPPADLVRIIKSKSSFWLNRCRAPDRKFGWQSGYGVFSVGPSQVPRVVQYIQSQAEHHQSRSFRDELEVLLRHHDIDFDSRYLVD
jgi:REP element-mobilizing transposase RayT